MQIQSTAKQREEETVCEECLSSNLIRNQDGYFTRMDCGLVKNQSIL